MAVDQDVVQIECVSFDSCLDRHWMVASGLSKELGLKFQHQL